jgi:glycosyltransferase involved in cell wall biosynthesis
MAKPGFSGLISVIVATYNRSDALLAVLDGFNSQTDRGFEVIVADDGSRAEHVEALVRHTTEWNFPLRHVWHPDIGFTLAAVRNLGVLQANGAYLVFLDGDCIPQPDFIARHRSLARPRTFVIGSRILLDATLSRAIAAERPIIPLGNIWRRCRLRAGGHINKLLATFIRWPSHLRKQRATFRWKGIRGCNMALWRSDYEVINGFDESFDGWGHEDADIVLRLHRAGCSRIDGYWSTEVLHLWHPEASRGQENENYRRVLERIRDPACNAAATRGLSNSQGAFNTVKITTLSV